MGTLSFLFKHGDDGQIDPNSLPWYKLPSIYAHIKANINFDGDLTDEGIALPDEERRFHDTEIRWIAGAMEGAFGHHFGGDADKKKARKIASLVKEIARKNSQAKKVVLYNLLLEDVLLDYIDTTLGQIVGSRISPQPYLHEFIRWLAKEGADRGPVKFAIALLGVIGDPDDKEIVTLLGKHEEFTLYSAVALSNMLDDPALELWELAKYVHGWGRIHLVERLLDTENPDIQDWLLREGYKNDIMYEYLAYTCAATGDLKAALSQETIDDELLISAGEIIEALIYGGPAEDINDYEDAAVVLQNYVKHLEPRADRLEQFLIVHTIYDYLSGLKDNWKERKKQGWTFEIRNTLLQATQRIIQRPQWEELVNSKLSTQNDMEFYIVSRSAELLGIDIWDIHWKRLQEQPFDPRRWQNIMNFSDDGRIQSIVDFALEQLPLDQISTGPAHELGLGKEYNIHHCLDCILQDLGDYPGFGVPLIETALKSPVTRNRHMALRTLSQWEKDQWDPEVENILEQALTREPDEDVRKSIQRVIEGKSIE
jgi:hypothetical protein